MVRRSRDASYLEDDPALELDGARPGPAAWWPIGAPGVVGDVLRGTERSRAVGYDLVFAAPRAISLLLALDPEASRGLVEAHRESVAASLDYLQERGVVTRDRRGGGLVVAPGEWPSAAAFTHGVNRHGEPHLHDHVLVGAAPAGSERVLDSRSLYAHARSADALYRAGLRAGVAERTPWRAWRSFSGVEHVAGVDEGYRALWGGHHDERGDKLEWGRAQALARWADDRQRLDERGAIPAPAPRDTLDEHAFGAALEGLERVNRRDLVAAWADAATYGARATEVSRALDALYPALAASRGLAGPTLGRASARMSAAVRERGARPLDPGELSRWASRERGHRELTR